MTFLNYIMLFGLAAVAVPVIIHLLNRRKARTVDWGAMQFLLASLASRNRRILIEEVILMALRCLTVALIALALARPYLPSRSTVSWAMVMGAVLAAAVLLAVGTVAWSRRGVRWGALALAAALLLAAALAAVWEDQLSSRRWGTGGGEKDVAIVIDGSLSMTMTVEGRSNFQRAVEEARGVIASCRPADAISITLAGSCPRGVVPTPISDRKELSAKLDALSPTNGSMRVLEALAAAGGALGEGHNPGKKIVLITDGQDAGWDLSAVPGAWGGQSRWKFLSDTLGATNGRPEVILRRLPLARTFNNLAIDDLTFARKIVGVDRPVKIDVKIANTGSNASAATNVELLVDGLAVGHQAVGEITPNASQTVSFLHQFDRPGARVVTARLLDEDDIPGDNVAARVLDVMEQLPVLIIEGAPAAGPLGSSGAFLEIAMAPLDPNAAGPGAIPAPAGPAAAAGGEDDLRCLLATRTIAAPDVGAIKDFSPFRLVVLSNVPALPKATQASLYAFVRNGGGLLITPGDLTGMKDKAQTSLYDDWAGPSGEPISPARLIKRVSTNETPIHLAVKSFSHPALELITDVARSDAESALIHNYWQLEADEKNPDIRVGGLLETGSPLLVERKVGKGRVLMSAFAFDHHDTNLPGLKCFVPLVHELVYYLTDPSAAGANYRCGSDVSMELPAGGVWGPLNSGDLVEVVTPSKARRGGVALGAGGAWRINFAGADEPGAYRVLMPAPRTAIRVEPALATSQPAAPEVHFAVLNEPAESRLAPLSDGQLANARNYVDLQLADTAAELTAFMAGGVPGKEIWRYLIILAAAGLVIEIALTRWIARRRRSDTVQPVDFGADILDVADFRAQARRILSEPAAKESSLPAGKSRPVAVNEDKT